MLSPSGKDLRELTLLQICYGSCQSGHGTWNGLQFWESCCLVLWPWTSHLPSPTSPPTLLGFITLKWGVWTKCPLIILRTVWAQQLIGCSFSVGRVQIRKRGTLGGTQHPGWGQRPLSWVSWVWNPGSRMKWCGGQALGSNRPEFKSQLIYQLHDLG